jgi:hypothetical protein
MLFAAVVLLVGCQGKNASGRLLFVVPDTLPSGESSATARIDFERWLAQEAGGYTAIEDVQGGWLDPAGNIIREPNVLYLVSTKSHARRLQEAVRQRILQDFQQQEAYVERW